MGQVGQESGVWVSVGGLFPIETVGHWVCELQVKPSLESNSLTVTYEVVKVVLEFILRQGIYLYHSLIDKWSAHSTSLTNEHGLKEWLPCNGAGSRRMKSHSNNSFQLKLAFMCPYAMCIC